ncbi:MAG TPA: DUF1801 domain-containing protein [Burkholderiaceae bacterium]|nr:DUF1801 domain-containing protein [Burkholderiaceae bacterium]
MRSVLRPGALIESWFNMLPQEQRATARALQAAVHASGVTLSPSIRWGNLVFQHEGTNAVAIVPHKSHVNLQLFKGAPLVVRYPQLEGTGKGVRHLKVKSALAVDEDLVKQLVVAVVEVLRSAPADSPG